MMTMTGEHPRPNPTVQIPPWDNNYVEDPMAHIHSPISHGVDASHYENAMAALQRYLPSNMDDFVPVDAFSCDNFRMFEFKVKKCAFAKSHDWTECPFAHPGEKARRRDPRKYHYSGSACPNFRKGLCMRGDACEYAHGVFESWLHPSRYRTQPCKDGIHCRRRVCFFAHTLEQLRAVPHSSSPDASPSRLGQDSFAMGLFGSPPKSTLYSPPSSSPTTGSPPVSPSGSINLNSVNQLTESMRCLQLNKMKMGMGLSMSPPSWGIGFGSPRSPRPGLMSVPSTPVRAKTRSALGACDAWGISCEEEPMMEIVESGRVLRERIYEKLGRENSLDRGRRVDSVGGGSPDFEWVVEDTNETGRVSNVFG